MVAAGKASQSRQTCIAGALVIALLGLWVVTLYGAHLMRSDHQRQEFEQQRATLSIAVRTIERDLAGRQAALAVFAANLVPAAPADRVLLRQVLDRQVALAGLFPNGLSVTGPDGVALATMQAGLRSPERPPGGLTLAAPLRDAAGTTIGVVSGSIDAESPGLLAGITLPRDEVQGALLLVAPGASALLDRLVQGGAGPQHFTNPDGVQMVGAAMGVAGTPWHLVTWRPAVLAQAPLQPWQSGVLLAGVALTLFAGLLLWWLLRRSQALTPAGQPDRDQPYRALLEALPEAIVISRRGQRLYANPAAARLLGADSAAELVGQSIFDLLSPEALADLTAQRDLFHGLNEPFLLEVRSCKRDGTTFDAEIRGTPFLYQGQNAVLTVTRDVTARKTVQEEWRKLSLVVNQTPHSVVITDTAGRIEYVNEAFVQASGFGRGSVLGRDMSLLKSGKTPSETYRSLWTVLSDGRIWIGEFVNRRSDGREYIDAAIITPLRRPDGSISHYVSLQQDVTERVQLLEELRRHRDELEGLVTQRTAELTLARQQADLANNAKSRFLAAASHDLRQPLAALALYVGILKRPHGLPTAEVVDQIDRCVGQLSELLTDLLDLSKLDAGVVAPKLSDFALTDALRPLLSIYGAKARNKGLQLRCRASIVLVRTDVQWLSRLLGNLLDNAVEYTRQGGVLVACRRHQGRQWLEVWDTGVGIPPDQTSVVFEEFRQLG
ncbi:MAG: hypothetical protein RIS90_2814, partial [Pseudomonadota bacterium]